MNSKNLSRTRNTFIAFFGALALFGILAFAPQADASPTLKHDNRIIYGPGSKASAHARQNTTERAKKRNADTDKEADKPKPKGRLVPRVLGGFLFYTGKHKPIPPARIK